MREEYGNEQRRSADEIDEQDGARRPVVLKDLATMSLEELLYYVLAGDGRQLSTRSV